MCLFIFQTLITDCPRGMQNTELILFFFYSYTDPQSLHSFPTRRSSDLAAWSAPASAPVARQLARASRTGTGRGRPAAPQDRKSTRLNSSHVAISYAVFCLKKKKS